MPVPDRPGGYVPRLVALKLPEIMLGRGLSGIGGAIIDVAARNRGGTAGHRAALLAVGLAATLPILITIAARPAMYNGIRHFVFLAPPFAVLGALARAWIARPLQPLRRTALAVRALSLFP